MGLFERNLNKCGQLIDIQSRATVGATFGNSNPEQSFTTKHAAVKSIVQTPKGKATFDDVGLGDVVTHKFCIAWVDGITSEDWIVFKSKRYDILNDMNCCEKDSVITMFCRLRGEGEASKG